MNSRELVIHTLEGKNTGRAPRQLWVLPWAVNHYKEAYEQIIRDFPSDFDGPVTHYAKWPKTSGDAHAVGTYVDEWGCIFENKQAGIIGEVKEPLVKDDDWEDADQIHIPEEFLSFDINQVNEACKNSSKFLMSGCCPRPFEQLQFIRGTENFYMDLMMRPKKMFEFMEKMHDFYCRLLTKWAQTDVDALNMMDDWGAQNSLLINPKLWDEIFRPMYKDYIDIAHKHGKKMFMHSDGYTLDIIPRLIDLGLDAMNAQIFCMGIDNLAQYKGHITFWGEIDRQHILPYGSPKDVEEAVKKVYDTLWQQGHCIAQCEFGIGAKPENVYKVFETWDQLTK